MSRATFKTDASASVYDRVVELGIGQRALGQEFVAGVVLNLKTFPAKADQKPRDVRVRLDWPAGLKFDNATIAEQHALEAWLVRCQQPSDRLRSFTNGGILDHRSP